MGKTILMFPYTHQLGTTHSLIAVADELQNKGFNIVFACDDGNYNSYIEEAGYKIEYIEDIDYELYRKTIDSSNMKFHNKKSIERFIEAELELINQYNPVAIIDMIRVTLKISSKIANIPRFTFIYTILTNYYDGFREIPESHWLHPLSVNPITKGFINSQTPKLVDYFMKKWTKPYNQYIDENKVPLNINSMREMYEGDYTILIDALEFAPAKELPKNVVAVGPILHTHKNEVPEWFNELDPKKKKVFVSMGSSGRLFPSVLQECIDIFKDENDIDVIATTAKRHELPQKEFPKNFHITDYIPADLVFKNNCILNITHGGRGSIYHSLESGVPIVGIPHQGEQEWNLNAVERLGLGKKVSKKKFTQDELRKAIYQVIRDKMYQKNSKKFAKILDTYRREKHASEFIHEKIKNHS